MRLLNGDRSYDMGASGDVHDEIGGMITVAGKRSGWKAPMRPTPRGREAGSDARAGFTLLEVLIATGLLGLVALAVAPLMLMAVQTSAAAQEATELTTVGSEQVEILRTLPFNDPKLAAGGSLTTSDAGFSEDPVNGDANRYMRWRITDESASRKHIELVVGIRSSVWGPPRKVVLETYRTDLQ